MEVSIFEIINEKDIAIIDIRENYLYQQGHVTLSKNIPYLLLKQMPNKYLDKNKVYYLYCSMGQKSKQLSNYLNNLGYLTFYVKEGYDNFKNGLSMLKK